MTRIRPFPPLQLASRRAFCFAILMLVSLSALGAQAHAAPSSGSSPALSPEQAAKKYVKGQSQAASTERQTTDTGEWLAQPMDPLSQEPLQDEPLVEEPLTFEDAGAAFVPKGLVESRNRCQQADRALQRDALIPRLPMAKRLGQSTSAGNDPTSKSEGTVPSPSPP
jgi:hypothetical protein